LPRELQIVKPAAGRDNAESRSFSANEIKKLFERPDAEGAKLCFYWQV
jgi:hypothetical protein